MLVWQIIIVLACLLFLGCSAASITELYRTTPPSAKSTNDDARVGEGTLRENHRLYTSNDNKIIDSQVPVLNSQLPNIPTKLSKPSVAFSCPKCHAVIVIKNYDKNGKIKTECPRCHSEIYVNFK